jgi:hypothetical protein
MLAATPMYPIHACALAAAAQTLQPGQGGHGPAHTHGSNAMTPGQQLPPPPFVMLLQRWPQHGRAALRLGH